MSEFGMTREEREAFLADTHVAVVAIAEEGRAPLAVPVWYAYEPGGEIRFVTGPNSRKGRLLKRAARASLCVQTEAAPYRYVSVEGPTSLGPVDYERDVRGIAHRYLGPELGQAYLAATADVRRSEGEVLVTIRPQRWYSVDYGKKAW
jgi:PPOX class probable F420-dependent enzyme